MFSEYEEVFLFDKDLNADLWRSSMYGEVTCGLIGLNNEWTVAGGESLLVWTNETLQLIDDQEIKWIHDLRQTGDYQFELLVDPWSDQSAVWSFDIQTMTKVKVRDFADYRDKPYTEDIKW